MRHLKYALFTIFIFGKSLSQSVEKYKSNQSLTYQETIAAYNQLDKKYETALLTKAGSTDVGKPLHLFMISSDKVFNPVEIQKRNYCFLLINNGIHPGEPDGIDASVKLAADLLSGKISLPKHVVIGIIPVYNVDGSLNRGCCSRVNQEGPEEYGFRGNAQNLDLNRDFIKCDSENAKSFTKIFHKWNPDVFVDTHVSNGADYQYTMTLIDTQKDKLNPVVSNYVQQVFLPELYTMMEQQNFEMCPYVNAWSDTPDKGFEGFLETPRFATGYAALFNCISFVTETHMLKPFPQRVEATYVFLKSIIALTESNNQKIKSVRKEANIDCINRSVFALQWQVDTTEVDSILFKGYEAKYKTSSVTGLQQLYYDQQNPYTKYVPFYNSFKPTVEINKPFLYIIPQAFKSVIDRLELNKIAMKRFTKDTSINVECYFIKDYQCSNRPYEGHHLKTNVKVKSFDQVIQFFAGDYLIECNQEANRYIIETLEPQGIDSWFTWGFFDAVLQQKEWFSDYVFEPKAAELLRENPELRKELESKKLSDADFAKNSWAQLTYIYQHSSYYEKTHNRYPVYRLNKKIKLPAQ